MGTTIELTVGNVSLAYAKNHMGADYGVLFQDGDESRHQSNSINYEYYEEHPDEKYLAESEAAFVRSLSRVIPRISLLGHTLDGARAEYLAVLNDAAEISDDNDKSEPAPLTFEEFCSLACLFPLSSLASEYIDFDTEERAKIAQGRFSAHAELFDRIPWTENSDMYWSESSYLAAKMCILSPPSMLQIFNLNPENAQTEVMWQFGPIVNAGWVNRQSFQPGARREQRILVATEGASDVRILRHALNLLRPDVADFFCFIDENERHHFWGTGKLVNFAEGLQRIDVQNQILFLLDNDVAGVEAHNKLKKLNLPSNMRSVVLPNLDEFRNFPARGPHGISNSDINGKAAAIECYLDLALPNGQQAQVIWSNYREDLDAWHGVLEHKNNYVDCFMKQGIESIKNGGYNASKLARLLDALIAEAASLSAGVRNSYEFNSCY
jgi:hypothetical protein